MRGVPLVDIAGEPWDWRGRLHAGLLAVSLICHCEIRRWMMLGESLRGDVVF
jgi:hypothetical protein